MGDQNALGHLRGKKVAYEESKKGRKTKGKKKKKGATVYWDTPASPRGNTTRAQHPID